MKSLQEYRTIYRNIAQNLGYRGDVVELLVHLLANATYIEEVENISFALESSLEKAHLDNSKIQHCMDLMYSIYRGSCPRVYMKIKAGKIKTLEPYSEIATSSNFNVYFLAGIRLEDGKEIKIDFNQESLQLSPEKTYIICGFISKSPVKQVSTINYTNRYYIDLEGSNLSHDMFVQINKHGAGTYYKYKTTTDFKEYLLESSNGEKYVFDLTTSDYGSRLYFKDSSDIEPSDEIITTYFPYIRVSNLLHTELQKISTSLGELCEFSGELESIGGEDINGEYEVLGKGLIVIKESDRESLSNIHYEANKSRYQNSIVRSNEDMGYLLQRKFSDIVKEAGCEFSDDNVVIYYIPMTGKRLSDEQKREFIDGNLAYYISSDIQIYNAPSHTLNLDISIVLSSAQSTDTLRKNIEDNILSKYESDFSAAKAILTSPDEVLNQISSAISRLTGVDFVRSIKFDESELERIDTSTSKFLYFNFNCNINSSLS